MMARYGALGLLLCVIVGLGCQRSSGTEGNQQPMQTTPLASAKLSARAIDELSACEGLPKLVAVVRCDDTKVQEQGTRSENTEITATVLAIGHGQTNSKQIQLARYSQNDRIMNKGQAYLVAACDTPQWKPAWTLIEAIAVNASEAEPIARQAGAQVR
jgi:hypothetical protein